MSETAIFLQPDNIAELKVLFQNRIVSDQGSELEQSGFVMNVLATALRTALVNPEKPTDKNNGQVSTAETDFIRTEFLKRYGSALKKYPSFYSLFGNRFSLNTSQGKSVMTSLEEMAAELQKDIAETRIENAVQKYRVKTDRYFFRSTTFSPLPDFFKAIPDHPAKLQKPIEQAIAQGEDFLAVVLASEDLLNPKNPRRFKDAIKILAYYQEYQYYFAFAYALCNKIPGATGFLKIEGKKLSNNFYSPHWSLIESKYYPALYRIVDKISKIIGEKYHHVESKPTSQEIADFVSLPYDMLHERTRMKITHAWLKKEKSYFMQHGAHLTDLKTREKFSNISLKLKNRSDEYKSNVKSNYPSVHLTKEQLNGLNEDAESFLKKSSNKIPLTQTDLEKLLLSDDAEIREQAHYLLTGNYEAFKKIKKPIVSSEELEKIKTQNRKNWELLQEILVLEEDLSKMFGKNNYGELKIENYQVFKNFPDDVDNFLEAMLQLSATFYKRERMELKEAEHPWDIVWAANRKAKRDIKKNLTQITPEESQRRIDNAFNRSDHKIVYIKDEENSALPYFAQRGIEIFDNYTQNPKTKKLKHEGKEIRVLYSYTDKDGFTNYTTDGQMEVIRSWNQGPGLDDPICSLEMNFKSRKQKLTLKELGTHRHENGHVREVNGGKYLDPHSREWMSTNLEGRYFVNQFDQERRTNLQPEWGKGYDDYLFSTIKGMIWNELRKDRKQTAKQILDTIRGKLKRVGIDEPDLLGEDYISAEFHAGLQHMYGGGYPPGDLINLFNQTLSDEKFFKIFHRVEIMTSFVRNFFERYKDALKRYAPEMLPINVFSDVVRNVIKIVNRQ